MKCQTAEEFGRAKDFYLNVLGLSVKREWAEGIMIDTGNGLIEIFNNGEGSHAKGAIRHFALLTYPARMAFCTGPLGEEIELFCER